MQTHAVCHDLRADRYPRTAFLEIFLEPEVEHHCEDEDQTREMVGGVRILVLGP